MIVAYVTDYIPGPVVGISCRRNIIDSLPRGMLTMVDYVLEVHVIRNRMVTQAQRHAI
jgi:hypothetical protein